MSETPSYYYPQPKICNGCENYVIDGGVLRQSGDPMRRRCSVEATPFSANCTLKGMVFDPQNAIEKGALSDPPNFNKSGSKYLRDIRLVDGRADVYAVLEAFDVRCPARQHAIKKLLCAGIRGKGGEMQDLSEARDAVDRAIQMQLSRLTVRLKRPGA